MMRKNARFMAIFCILLMLVLSACGNGKQTDLTKTYEAKNDNWNSVVQVVKDDAKDRYQITFTVTYQGEAVYQDGQVEWAVRFKDGHHVMSGTTDGWNSDDDKEVCRGLNEIIAARGCTQDYLTPETCVISIDGQEEEIVFDVVEEDA